VNISIVILIAILSKQKLNNWNNSSLFLIAITCRNTFLKIFTNST